MAIFMAGLTTTLGANATPSRGHRAYQRMQVMDGDLHGRADHHPGSQRHAQPRLRSLPAHAGRGMAIIMAGLTTTLGANATPSQGYGA